MVTKMELWELDEQGYHLVVKGRVNGNPVRLLLDIIEFWFFNSVLFSVWIWIQESNTINDDFDNFTFGAISAFKVSLIEAAVDCDLATFSGILD